MLRAKIGPNVPRGFWLSVKPSLSKSTENSNLLKNLNCETSQTHLSKESKWRCLSEIHPADTAQMAWLELARWSRMCLAVAPAFHHRSPKSIAFVASAARFASRCWICRSPSMTSDEIASELQKRSLWSRAVEESNTNSSTESSSKIWKNTKRTQLRHCWRSSNFMVNR